MLLAAPTQLTKLVVPAKTVHLLVRVAQGAQLLVLPALRLQLYTTILVKLIAHLVLTILRVFARNVYLLVKAAQMELHVIIVLQVLF